MKLKIRLFVLTLSLLALFSTVDNKSFLNAKAAPKGNLQYLGCWSPYPNCVGAADIFRDDNGNVYSCGSCDGSANNCKQIDPTVLPRGYWCS